ncbi:MAG TPA: hypothetical protein VIQ24_01610 [Pyrinomonadaceae bacterium]
MMCPDRLLRKLPRVPTDHRTHINFLSSFPILWQAFYSPELARFGRSGLPARLALPRLSGAGGHTTCH